MLIVRPLMSSRSQEKPVYKTSAPRLLIPQPPVPTLMQTAPVVTSNTFHKGAGRMGSMRSELTPRGAAMFCVYPSRARLKFPGFAQAGETVSHNYEPNRLP